MYKTCPTFVLIVFSCFWFVYSNEGDPDIIIVGAGASGIAAATKLWEYNFTNIKILEAENRIGGMIQSVKLGDAFVDLGGEWCEGNKDNIVYDLVKKYNILKPTNLAVKMIYSNGTYIDQDIYHTLMDFAKFMTTSNHGPKPEQSCVNFTSNCLAKMFQTWIAKKYKKDSSKLNIGLEAMEWLQSSLQGSVTAFTFYEGRPLNWNGLGFKTVLDVMLQKYPDQTKTLPVEKNILLHKEVSRISWKNSSTPKVNVRCSDGTVYNADHVIFTPSLGVLKASYKKMFQPELPSEKVEAIKNFGFGAVVKIALHFPSTWWNVGEAYEFIWSADDKENIASEFGKGPVKDGRSWLTTSIMFLTAENNPKVMIGFFSGDMVPLIEAEDDEVLLEGCMYMFRKFLGGRFSVVNADKILKSLWYTNPHFGGTFTYDNGMNGTGTTYPESLATPLKREDGTPLVLFAGEATHSKYYSTVHGAIETGYREAMKIMELYRNKICVSFTLF